MQAGTHWTGCSADRSEGASAFVTVRQKSRARRVPLAQSSSRNRILPWATGVTLHRCGERRGDGEIEEENFLGYQGRKGQCAGKSGDTQKLVSAADRQREIGRASVGKE